jgi:flagellar assembly protein FliH
MTSSDERARAERRAAPKPARAPLGGRPAYPADGGPKVQRDLYSRFIPREELSSFESWSFGDVSAAAAPAGAPTSREAEAPLDPAELQAQQLRAARQSGYQDGYRDGLVALEGFKQSFAHQATLQVGQLVKAIGGQLDAMQQEMAEALAATALALARQIVRSELAARPQSVATVAQEALETLMLSARHITLRVHPDDQPLIAEGAGELLAARGARLVADTAIARGGCVVESNIGLVDASIETRWRRAAASIGSDEPWRPAADASEPGPGS